MRYTDRRACDIKGQGVQFLGINHDAVIWASLNVHDANILRGGGFATVS